MKPGILPKISDRKIRVGLVGCGRISKNHFKAISQLTNDLELIALCDTELSALKNSASKYKVAGYENISAMFEKEKLDLVKKLSESSGHLGIAGGQYLDLSFERKKISKNKIIDMEIKKTGKLFSFCCAVPAIIKNKKRKDIKFLENIGANIGLLFQIADDLIDLKGSSKIAGKLTGKDKKKGKATLISLLGYKNAIKYSDHGGTVSLTLTMNGEGLIQFNVTDQGVGIPAEEHDKIFERFYRVDPARSRNKGGTGLGLSIVKHVVERYQGRIKLVSRPGQGASFSVTFPILQPDPTR